MASSSCSSDEDSKSRHKHSSRHKKKEKSHKKTKKRYKSHSDNDEKGYKKIKRKKEKKMKRSRKDSDSEFSDTPQTSQKSQETLTPPRIEERIPDSEPSSSREEAPKGDAASYGPSLPPHLMKNLETKVDSTLPTFPEKKDSNERLKPKVIGPALPQHLLQSKEHEDIDEALEDEIPAPSSVDSDSDINTVGPLPGVINTELEERALQIKLGLVSAQQSNNPDNQTGREEWMIELPQVKGVSDLGLTARQFRTKERPDFSDRSEWTDTPGDKERKKKGVPSEKDLKKQKELEEQRELLAQRDAEQERVAKEHKKKHKREKSLMDLHEEKLKKAKKDKANEPKERRPFDRNLDLGANRFDEAQKKSIIKKAQLLDTRFSSGASKFL